MTERNRLDLRGLLPPNVMFAEQQIDRFEEDLNRLALNVTDGPSDTYALAKWRILNRLHDRNETMCYKVLSVVDTSYGYNAATAKYEDLMAAGILDPSKEIHSSSTDLLRELESLYIYSVVKEFSAERGKPTKNLKWAVSLRERWAVKSKSYTMPELNTVHLELIKYVQSLD